MVKPTEKTDDAILTIRVVPRASKSEIVGFADGVLKIRIASPPVDGAANAELVKLLSKTFDVSKSRIAILSGQTSKMKQVKIGGIKSNDLPRFLPLKGR